MGNRARLLIVASASFAASELIAQSVGRMVVDDVAHTGGDLAAIWLSPFHASSRDWRSTAGAVGGFGVSMLADRGVARWAARSEGSRLLRALKPVRTGGAAYSAKLIAPPLAALYVAGLALDRQDLREAATGCVASWFSQSMMRQATYRLVARQRPDTSPNDPNRWDVPGSKVWELQSFPAGHFANTVACATFWSGRYRLGYGAPVLYALAAAVGLGRIADAGHWTSDTVLGGIIGYAAGREVARRSRARAERATSDAGGSAASPSTTRRVKFGVVIVF